MKTTLLLLFLFIGTIINAQTSFTNSTGGSIPPPPDYVLFPVLASGLPNAIDTSYGLVTVCFDIVHTQDADLDIRLQSPDGTTVLLSNNNGGSGENYTGTCVAENATGGEISVQIAPFTGTFYPDHSLNGFNDGQNPNGTWYLFIHDEMPGDTGHLVDFTITFDFNPPPTHISAVCNTNNAFGCSCPDGTLDCDLLPDMVNSGVYLASDWVEHNGHLNEGVCTPNIGYGPMELHGTGECYCDSILVNCGSTCPDGTNPKEMVNQTIYHKHDSTMTSYTIAAGTMTYHPSHGHIHVDDWTYNTLRIRGLGEDPTNWPIIGEGSKQSFCLINLGTCSSNTGYCVNEYGDVISESSMPNGGLGDISGCGEDQGIYVGSYDIYSSGTDGQQIDFGTICDGQYYIVSITNPDHIIHESNYNNNWSTTLVNLTHQVDNCCTANFFADATYGVAPFEVQFVDSTIPIANSWSWDFGDGFTSTDQFPQHVYTQPGVYTVKLFTNNNIGCTDTVSRLSYITVDMGTSSGTLHNPDFSLLAYPNPFKNTTTIKYSLDVPSYLELSIVDVVGNTVKQLTHGYMHSGDHEISFDAKKEALPNGFYFVKAVAGTKESVVKMVKVE